MRIVLFLFLFVTFCSAQVPQVAVQTVNSPTVGQYEKFEIIATISNLNYTNAYNAKEVDLRAVFTAPSGKVWEIFGFYDNYQSTNKWKVRFAPNETGEWSYRLTLQSPVGDAQSDVHSFTTTESAYHGWIRVSPVNPHYFIHDDGTPYYGVGPYYPWGVNNSTTGLAQLEASGCNFWGYWNIMYDTGEIIESINSGLGRYDQPKCGWIDQLITWSEQRGLKMMLAIWPHDLLSNTVWAHQWHNNPYKNICDVEEFYESEVAWTYQEMQYRYIIARWGYSRALAIWEIVNEVNGTDGWQVGKENEARIWVGRVHDFLTANDPHQRPTTASMSGGHYWSQGYAEVDIPNVHLYETDWAAMYPGNALRSSAYTYYKVAKQLWDDFEKPAIYGEAGYTASYGSYPPGSREYTAWFHNSLWAAWCGGLSVTPVWWAFESKQLMTNEVMAQMLSFSKIVRDYDHSYQNFNSYQIAAAGCDVYALRSDSSAFGWVRQEYGSPVKGYILNFDALQDTSWQITWYNTWIGDMIGQEYIVGSAGTVSVTVPETTGDIPDAAFFLNKTAEGVTPAQIRLGTTARKIYVKRNEEAYISCTIHDDVGRFVRIASNAIRFRVEGPGRFTGPDMVDAVNGKALIGFTADSSSGLAKIIAESPGLVPDTVIIDVANRIPVDDFESYKTVDNLEYVWHPRAGTTAIMSLTGSITGEPGYGLKVSYDISDGHAPYAGVYRYLSENLMAAEQLEFWLRGDASGRTLAILIFERNGRYWQYDQIITDDTAGLFSIPLTSFTASDTATSIQPDQVDEISFNILKGDGEAGQGAFSLDDINFVIPALETYIGREPATLVPDKFSLLQNYPNPFNNVTTIRYNLPAVAKVTIEVFDSSGRMVERLLDGETKSAGENLLRWNASGMASGVYFYRVRAGAFEAVRKCILLK